MNNYNPNDAWSKKFLNSTDMAFPSEYVIRIFKGKYPELNLSQTDFLNKKICDIGCGDGRNIVLLDQCKFQTFGTEITEKIVEKTKNNLAKLNIISDIRVAKNDDLPFENNFFDFLLSWNSSYYMGENKNFQKYVEEFNRILMPNGFLVISIPKKTCFIFSESETVKEGYVRIQNDPFNVRNGEILRIFNNEQEIQDSLSEYFTDFIFGSIEDNCFGLNYHWHILVCKKKSS